MCACVMCVYLCALHICIAVGFAEQGNHCSQPGQAWRVLWPFPVVVYSMTSCPCLWTTESDIRYFPHLLQDMLPPALLSGHAQRLVHHVA